MATPAELAALDAAIISGASEVRFQDRTVRYQNVQSMLAARTLLFNQLNPDSSTANPPVKRQIRIFTDKGV